MKYPAFKTPQKNSRKFFDFEEPQQLVDEGMNDQYLKLDSAMLDTDCTSNIISMSQFKPKRVTFRSLWIQMKKRNYMKVQELIHRRARCLLQIGSGKTHWIRRRQRDLTNCIVKITSRCSKRSREMANGRVLAPDGRQHQVSRPLRVSSFKISHELPEQETNNDGVMKNIIKFAKDIEDKESSVSSLSQT